MLLWLSLPSRTAIVNKVLAHNFMYVSQVLDVVM
jgi:hypothetical protein